MNTMHAEARSDSSFKDVLLQVGVWGLLVVGFLVICAGVPLLALSA